MPIGVGSIGGGLMHVPHGVAGESLCSTRPGETGNATTWKEKDVRDDRVPASVGPGLNP